MPTNLITNGTFDVSLSGWTVTPNENWDWNPAGASYVGVDEGGTISQDILTENCSYNIQFELKINPPGNAGVLIYAGTNVYGPLTANTSVNINLACFGGTEFSIYAISSNFLDEVYVDDVVVTLNDCSECPYTYCITNTGFGYDGNYLSGGTYNGQGYWSSSTHTIYYNSGDTKWCLSTTLGGSCLLFGKSPCTTNCPDICEDYLNSGVCPTPTPTPTINCNVLDFDAIFNCEVSPTPTVTPSITPTSTLTPTPTSTDVCGYFSLEASGESYTPTPTPTPTLTPTPSGEVIRPINFSGNVTFNTLDSSIQCSESVKFQDCFNGEIYYATDYTSTIGNVTLQLYEIYQAYVNGELKCISYLGVDTQTIGINNIQLVGGPFGFSNEGGCLTCIPEISPTPTPTMTPTPSATQPIVSICDICDLGFNIINNSIGAISVGNITGSCDNSITEYIINWVGPSPSTNVQFTSGLGTNFQPYLYSHPLTGSSEIIVPAGEYNPIIQKIEITGTTYSQTGGTGTIQTDFTNCLPKISVLPLTCDNGDSSNLPQYSHRFNYSASTAGLIPQTLSTTFELTANTNFFAWRFKGYDVPDKIKMTFSGSSYTEPIVIEYWEVGFNLTSDNYNINSFPKSADTSNYLSKVTCLTGLTVNNSDYILIEITPSTETTQTSWDLYCGCLDEFNCDFCEPQTASTVSGTSYQLPIILDSVTGITGTCATVVQFQISGCSLNDITGTSLYNYVSNIEGSGNIYDSDGIIGRTTNPLSITNSSCSQVGAALNSSCRPTDYSETITYEKSSGLFTVTSNSASTITLYYNNYITFATPNISPFSADSTNLGYYRYFVLKYPTTIGATECGDGTPFNEIYLHQSSLVTTGITGSDYYIQYTLPTVTNDLTGFTNCDLNCTGFAQTFVNTINTSSSAITNNYTGTTNVGSSYNNPIYRYWRISVNSPTTASTIFGYAAFRDYSNVTVPASGNTNTLIPNLSGETCPNILDNFYSYIGTYPNNNGFIKYYYNYIVELFDPLDDSNFRIYACQILQNGVVVTPNVKSLIYEFSGGTVTTINSDYFV